MSASTIDMTGQTRRLEPALRHLAKHGGHVADVAKRFKVEKADLWAWLGQFNRSKPALAEHTIDGVLTGLAAAPIKRGPAKGHAGLKRALERTRPSPALPAAINGPAGDAPELEEWLNEQGLEAELRASFVVKVSPALAAAWLSLNRGNRKPSRAKVKRFAAIMAAGKWILNGETVKFSVSGRLLDGQSRLQAIVEANVPADLEVRGGLPDAVQETMDCGESRRATHMLEMMGEENAKILSPALRFIFKWENGSLGTYGSCQVAGKMSILENLAVKPMLDRHGGIRGSVTWAAGLGWKLQKLVPLSEAAFFHYLFGRANRLKRDAFFERLLGNPDSMESPAVAMLRDRILGAVNGRLGAGVRLRLLVKAWNAHYAGKKIKELKIEGRESVSAIEGVKA